MKTNTCVVCSKTFEAPTYRHLTCSDDCRKAFQSWPRWSTRTCTVCEVEFQNDKHHPKRYCGVVCRNADRAKTRSKQCPTCNRKFTAQRAEQVYCSQACFGKANSGRGSRGGEVPLCECGQPIPNKARKYCSDECLVRYGKSREKSKPDTSHVCLACGNVFSRPWYYAGKKMYCSPACQKKSIARNSLGEKDVLSFIVGLGVEAHSDNLPSGQEIDIYCPEHKVGFEFNGAYGHSLVGLERRGVPKKNQIRYHLSKTNEAEKEGIRLYHIWSWEWEDPSTREIVKSQISALLGKVDNKIGARKCSVVEVDNVTATRFLADNHMLGRVNATVHYGLTYEDDLVAVMSFSPKGDDWLLSRFCVKRGMIVSGGASRLFEHFVREYRPKAVISYSDRAKATGEMYQQLGFEFSHDTDPEYMNLDPNRNRVYRRYQTRRSALLKKHQSLSDDMTEREMCDALGYTRIYGCGHRVWKWTKP